MERHVCVTDSVFEWVWVSGCLCRGVGDGSDQHLVARSGFFPPDPHGLKKKKKNFTEFAIVLLLLCMFWFWGLKACGILAPQPGMQPALPASDGTVLTSGPLWKSRPTWFLLELPFGGAD